MTIEDNTCDVSRCRTPLNAEEWCYAQVTKKKLLAVHNRCLEKIGDFDSTKDLGDSVEWSETADTLVVPRQTTGNGVQLPTKESSKPKHPVVKCVNCGHLKQFHPKNGSGCKMARGCSCTGFKARQENGDSSGDSNSENSKSEETA